MLLAVSSFGECLRRVLPRRMAVKIQASKFFENSEAFLRQQLND